MLFAAAIAGSLTLQLLRSEFALTVAPEECLCAGVPLAISSPVEGTSGADHWLNFSVQSASGGIVWSETQLQVVTPTGTPAASEANWTVEALSYRGALVATFDLNDQTWQSESPALVTSGQLLVVDAGPQDLRGHGDLLNIVLSSPFEGDLSTPIP